MIILHNDLNFQLILTSACNFIGSWLSFELLYFVIIIYLYLNVATCPFYNMIMMLDHEVILYLQANPRMTLFTGSSRVAEKLAVDLKGRVKLEDAGFDWKILGPDVHQVSYNILWIPEWHWLGFQLYNIFSILYWLQEDYTAWVCDQDAYACSGQKCSAQSLLFMHEVGHLDYLFVL